MASPTRTIVMTGSSSGFGRASALQLLEDPTVALVTIHRSRTLPSQDRLDDAPVDLADLAAVRDWVDGVAARLDAGDLPPLHAVVGNAGLQVADGPRRSAQGLDLTMAVNHLAHVLIIDRLLPHLTPGGRVVVTSSGTHHGGLVPRLLGVPGPREEPIARTADPDSVAPGPRTGRRQYSTSKLANAQHVTALSAERPDLTVLAFDPGLVPSTGLAREGSRAVSLLWNQMAPLLRRLPGANPPAVPAQTLAALVSDVDVPVSGSYVVAGQGVRPASAAATDAGLARAVLADSRSLIERSLEGVPSA